jgi:hydroxymethylglutaryl-CoA lyase
VKLVIQEVAPRDGLQIEPRWLETENKIALVDALSALGLRRIEVSSFVSPKAIPMLRDAEEVFAGIRRAPGVVYAALVPNLKGAERAVAAGADELNLVFSASETHNRQNMRMDCEASLRGFAEVARTVTGASLNGTIATAFGCPFEGNIAEERVLAFIDRLLALGFRAVTWPTPPAWPLHGRSNGWSRRRCGSCRQRRSPCTSTTRAASAWSIRSPR